MRAILLLLLISVLGAGTSFAQETKFNDFIPVGPAPIDYKTLDGRLFSEITVDEANNEQVINLLPNELTHKSIVVMNKDGEINFSAMELSEKDYTYIVRTDYIKYTTLPVRKDSETGEIVGIARIGVGLRIEATIRTSGSDITVTDLYALGEAAREGDLSGHLTVSVMGIESEEITFAFPINAEITPTAIASVLQAQTVVKSAIYDVDSHLTPQVLEIKYTEDYRNSVSNVTDLSMPILLPNRGEPSVVIR